MPRKVKIFSFRLPFAIVAGLALPACGDNSPPAPEFSGAEIAFGGGASGVKHACFRCHGLNGEGDGWQSPRLVGLDTGYLHRQLDDYANGRRRHDAMSAIAKHLKPEERARISTYYANLPLHRLMQAYPLTVRDPLYHLGDVRRGLLACADCHGQNGEGIGAGNPPLAQQPPKYVADQLLAWKRGDRHNDPRQVMLAVSQALTYVEIERLSVYVAGLSGGHRQAAPEAFPPAHRVDPKNDASMPRLRELE